MRIKEKSGRENFFHQIAIRPELRIPSFVKADFKKMLILTLLSGVIKSLKRGEKRRERKWEWKRG